MTTFLAPAVRCAAAASRLVKRPVDSTTTSTPRSCQGSFAGSVSLSTLIGLPSIDEGVACELDLARATRRAPSRT